MIWNVIEYAAILVECFIISRFMVKYFRMISEHYSILKWLSLFLLLFAVDWTGSFFINSEMFLVAGIVLVNIVFSVLFLKGNLFEKVIVSVSVYVMIYLVNIPVLTISSYISEMTPAEVSAAENPNINRAVGIIITKLLFFLVTQIVLSIRKKDCYRFKRNEWVIIVSAFIITLTVEFSLHALVVGYLPYEYIYIVIAVLLSLLDVIIFVFMGKLNKANKKEIEKDILQEKIFHQQNEVHQLEEQYKKISVIRHDYKNQLGCIRTLINKGKYSEAEEYLDECIGNKIGNIDYHVYSSSSVLNAVINEKFSAAEKNGITTSCKMLTEVPDNLEYDLSLLLSNLLDNAAEACEKNKCKSYINLSISESAGYIRVVVRNTIHKSVLHENAELKTDKEDSSLHGWGLQSVDRIAKKNMGLMDFYEEENEFIVSVLLLRTDFSNMGAEKGTLGAELLTK